MAELPRRDGEVLSPQEQEERERKAAAMAEAEKIALQILTLTRNGLFVSLRFMDTALCQFDYVSSEIADFPFSIHSMATTGEHLFYDPRYIIQQYMRDRKALSRDYLHIVLHCVFRHPFVSTKLDMECWDLACDIAVENTICELELKQTEVIKAEEVQKEIERIRKMVSKMNAENIYRFLLSEQASGSDILIWKSLFRRDEHGVWWETARMIEEEQKQKAEEESGSGEESGQDEESGKEQEESDSEEAGEESTENDSAEESGDEAGADEEESESSSDEEEASDSGDGEDSDEDSGDESGEDEDGESEDSGEGDPFEEEDDQDEGFEEEEYQEEYSDSPGGEDENGTGSDQGDPESESQNSENESSGEGSGGGNPGENPEQTEEEGADRDSDTSTDGLDGGNDGHQPNQQKNQNKGELNGNTEEGQQDSNQEPSGDQEQQGSAKGAQGSGNSSRSQGTQSGEHSAGSGGGGDGSQSAWQHEGGVNQRENGEQNPDDMRQLDGAVDPHSEQKEITGESPEDAKPQRGTKETGEMEEEGNKAPSFMHNGEQQEQLENKWKDISERMLVDLETSSKEWGDKSDSMVQSLKKINRDKYDYRIFLRKFSTIKEDIQLNDEEFDYVYYIYGLNHYGNIPLIEPLEYKEARKIHDFVIAIDTSGSCAGEVVQKFLDKTYSIFSQQENFFRKINLHIIQCDAEIQSDVKITDKEEFKEYMRDIEFKGFGGTDFRPVFEYVNQMIDNHEFDDLRGLIYFTDGNGVYPKHRPEYETAFVFVDDDEFDYEVPSWAMKLVLETSDITEEVLI